MPDTAVRYLATLKHIPPHPAKASASQIRAALVAEGFEVTLRTVQRDLKRLSAFFPLTSDEPARPAGWSWVGPPEDLPAMGPHTALTLLLAERFLEPLLPRATLGYLAGHVKQARRVLERLSRAGLEAWPAKVRVVPRGQQLLPARVKPAVLDAVYLALLEGRRLEARYRARGAAEPSEYEVNPLGLVFRHAVIYLVASLRDYDDVLQLALHRFVAARRLEKPARTPPGFDLDAYLASGAFAYPLRPGRTVRLVALFEPDAAAHLHETPLATDQRLDTHPDGRVRVRATVADTSELRWWLLGFGDQVEVVRPVALRREMARIAHAMARRYG